MTVFKPASTQSTEDAQLASPVNPQDVDYGALAETKRAPEAHIVPAPVIHTEELEFDDDHLCCSNPAHHQR